MQISIDLMPVLFQTFYQPNLDLKTYKSQDTNENCQDCFISKITSSRSLKFLANLKGRYQDKQIAECVIKKMQPSYFSGRFYFYSVIAVDKTSNARQAEFQAQPVKKNPSINVSQVFFNMEYQVDFGFNLCTTLFKFFSFKDHYRILGLLGKEARNCIICGLYEISSLPAQATSQVPNVCQFFLQFYDLAFLIVT